MKSIERMILLKWISDMSDWNEWLLGRTLALRLNEQVGVVMTLCAFTSQVLGSRTGLCFTMLVKVKVTLRLAVYRQSVRLGVKPF
jgi:hypothetical protein